MLAIRLRKIQSRQPILHQRLRLPTLCTFYLAIQTASLSVSHSLGFLRPPCTRLLESPALNDKSRNVYQTTYQPQPHNNKN